jgi:uncharacterized protein (DUF362 family)/Pyruvate/2-oxoacid:ferredoxin oxidoreductase delta subunit
MLKISILRCAKYDVVKLKETLIKLTDLIDFSWKSLENKNVLLKPNLLSSATPDKAVTTHPIFVRAVAELVIEARPASICVGDSPGIGSCRSILRNSGIEEALSGLPVKLGDFTKAISVTSTLGYHKSFSIASEVEEADFIINLPKIKTHTLLGLTCAVKNMFGTVVGFTKGRYHLEYGTNIDQFARMITDLCYRKTPQLTLVDGILAMDGNGPGSGDPYKLGLLLAGTDPIAIDSAVASILSIDKTTLPQFKAAEEGGYGVPSPDIVGCKIDEVAVSDFRPAEVGRGFSRIPSFLMKYAKSAVAVRPIVDKNKCKLCEECIKICPPVAMKNKDRKIIINRDICIGCFCCHEICPHKAIEIKRPIIGRIAAKFLK